MGGPESEDLNDFAGEWMLYLPAGALSQEAVCCVLGDFSRLPVTGAATPQAGLRLRLLTDGVLLESAPPSFHKIIGVELLGPASPDDSREAARFHREFVEGLLPPVT